jgi:FKBP-type peptidyl-prolyl cis-trans isomerase SlpA
MTDINKTKKVVTQDSKVSLHFSLSLADGTAVDGTTDGEPMTFTMGDGALIPAFESILQGMKVGDKQQVSLDPRESFGFPDEENKHWMERSMFSDDMELQEDLIFEFRTPAGDQVPGLLLELTDEKVLVDFNHPLAGHEIIFSVEILAIG